MRKNIAFGLVTLVLCTAAFWLGYKAGNISSETKHQQRDSYLEVINAIAAYSIQADIAQEIFNKNHSKALCLVQLQASAQVNKIKECLDTLSCRKVIESDVLRMAPEFLDGKELRIKYYKEGELCKP